MAVVEQSCSSVKKMFYFDRVWGFTLLGDCDVWYLHFWFGLALLIRSWHWCMNLHRHSESPFTIKSLILEFVFNCLSILAAVKYQSFWTSACLRSILFQYPSTWNIDILCEYIDRIQKPCHLTKKPKWLNISYQSNNQSDQQISTQINSLVVGF